MSPPTPGHTPLWCRSFGLRSFAPLSLDERGLRSLIVVVALLAPGVAVHVVAVGFPEAGGVGVHEADSADPFGGFPEVEVGDDHADGAAVSGFEWSVVEGVGEEAFAVDDVVGRQVGGVAAVAVSH